MMSKKELYDALEYLRQSLGDGEINYLLNRMADDPRYASLHATIGKLHAIHLMEMRESHDVMAKQNFVSRVLTGSSL